MKVIPKMNITEALGILGATTRKTQKGAGLGQTVDALINLNRQGISGLAICRPKKVEVYFSKDGMNLGIKNEEGIVAQVIGRGINKRKAWENGIRQILKGNLVTITREQPPIIKKLDLWA